MASRRIIDQHFYRVADEAVFHKPAGLDMPRMQFESKFGEAWRAVLRTQRVFNAFDAAMRMGMSDETFSRAWNRAVAANDWMVVEGTTQVARMIDQSKTVIYVINGHYMRTRARYTEKGARVYYFSVKWDPATTPWDKFYGNLVGHSVYSLSGGATIWPQSLQGLLLSEWSTMGLRGAAPTPTLETDLLYFSSSPLQGMADRVNWLDVPISSDSFGRGLMDVGIDEVTVRQLRNEALLADGSRLFDEVAGLNASECVEVCLAAAKQIRKKTKTATTRDVPVTTSAAGRIRRTLRPTIKRPSITNLSLSDTGDASRSSLSDFDSGMSDVDLPGTTQFRAPGASSAPSRHSRASGVLSDDSGAEPTSPQMRRSVGGVAVAMPTTQRSKSALTAANLKKRSPRARRKDPSVAAAQELVRIGERSSAPAPSSLDGSPADRRGLKSASFPRGRLSAEDMQGAQRKSPKARILEYDRNPAVGSSAAGSPKIRR
mmetsp:Transcript_16856/g.43839  ORF Transcript_16856/g.43839 Transcript_16856/m.43839 type:complete len:487 (-) Transcript_16856:1380-2840(-)